LARQLRVSTHDSVSTMDEFFEDAANNFLGFNVSTSGTGRRKRCFKKYATNDIHPRRVLLVVAEQVGVCVCVWVCMCVRVMYYFCDSLYSCE
jgi:hypothetical protein